MSQLPGERLEKPSMIQQLQSNPTTGAWWLPNAERTVITRIVQRVLRLQRSLDSRGERRVLLIEPDPPGLGQALRASGFHGEQWVIVRRPQAMGNECAVGSDHLLVRDEFGPHGRLGLATGASELNVGGLGELGAFHIIIACNLLHRSTPGQWASVVQPLEALLVPLGYLVLSEPITAVAMSHTIEPALAEVGLLLSTDYDSIRAQRPRTIVTFQNRGMGESRLVGVLQRKTSKDTQRSAEFSVGLTVAYREAFGGEEWREWVRCARPGCGRHYGRLEIATLTSSETCTCGWPEPLVPFHTPAEVLAKLQRDLADESRSCCYVRHGPLGQVEGFAWGHLTRMSHAVQALLPEHQRERGILRARLRRFMHKRTRTGGVGADVEAPVFYLSELGVVERARSLSLARALFQRTLQFGDDHGAGFAILRTSARANAYALLTGVGMHVMYRYSELLPRRSPDASDEQRTDNLSGTDERVVLAGGVREMLSIFEGESDRRLAWRIAQHLRQQRTKPTGHRRESKGRDHEPVLIGATIARPDGSGPATGAAG